MLYNHEIAEQTTEYLLQIKAIKLNNTNPFTWTSGWKSPIYCDNRKTLSYPVIRTYLRQQMSKIIQDIYGDVDLIAGVATGGIALGALVAQDLDKPFVYIRSSQKAHGLENKIEGVVESGQSVVIIEDLISTGNSSLKAVHALRDAGCKINGMLAIFSYDFEQASKNFEEAGCQLYTLSDYESLIKKASENGYVKTEELASLAEWRKSPETWGR